MLRPLCRLTKGHDWTIGLGCLPIHIGRPILGRLWAVQAQLLGNFRREALPARAVLVLEPPYRTYSNNTALFKCAEGKACKFDKVFAPGPGNPGLLQHSGKVQVR